MLGKFADFGGYDCESAPGIAGARGFDAGVQAQQVGLVGDAADDRDESIHGVDCLVERCNLFDSGCDVVAHRRERVHGLGRGRVGALPDLVHGSDGRVHGFAQAVDRARDARRDVACLVGGRAGTLAGVENRIDDRRDVVGDSITARSGIGIGHAASVATRGLVALSARSSQG